MGKTLFDLTGKNAVVIGGAGGLGQAIAQGLAEAGAKVLISSRNEESLRRAQGEIEAAAGVSVLYSSADASDEAQVEGLVADAARQFGGPVSILVNAQGFNKKQDALDFDIDVFRQMLEANVTSFMISAKHFGKHFKENGYGKIVNLSSVRGKIATKTTGNAGYCTTKGAVDMLTKQLASEFGPFGVTVNAVAPNITATPMMTKIFEMRAAEAGVDIDAYLKQQAAGLPMRKMSMPEDIVGTAVFLASEASDFMTGNILYPDGGLVAVG
ncbi:MAG: SDR family oxidoreductase [Clostridiales Family XIII bacterium]|jgi:gluconate 5-dehydrogenase|nr:SDR family oxidoreductase [Clostridiales Family XIII bacterium]